MPAHPVQSTTSETIIAIIRRDLMLGADVEVLTDTPLFGGDLDLDSLDALLLMQSLEKEFGFKLPSEAFGPDVFETVAALARFVEQRREDR
ncbi:MAG: acyl carrier protein [Planctomycetes bacterium]|nr:acyl carrier protein [Planctomycetota bacterium]